MVDVDSTAAHSCGLAAQTVFGSKVGGRLALFCIHQVNSHNGSVMMTVPLTFCLLLLLLLLLLLYYCSDVFASISVRYSYNYADT